MKITSFILSILLAFSYQCMTKDLTVIRDVLLEKKLHTDLKQLALETKKQASDESLKSTLKDIEDFYAPYPRVASLLVGFYRQMGQKDRAYDYQEKIKNFEHRFNKDEKIFFESIQSS